MKGITLILTLALLFLPFVGFASDPYGEGVSSVREAHLEGRFDEALLECRELRERFSQDYLLALLHGWSAVNAGEVEESLVAYQEAYALSGGSDEAALGMGHALVSLGELDRARAALAQIKEGAPFFEPAQALLESAELSEEAQSQIAFGAKVFYVDYSGESARLNGFGGVAGFFGDFGGLLTSLDYRFLTYASHQAPLLEPSPTPEQEALQQEHRGQHEGYLGLGWGEASWGVMVHGLVKAGGEEPNLGVGGTARWSLWGDLLFEGSGLRVDDALIQRYSFFYSHPISRFRVGVGSALQVVEDEALLSAEMGVGLAMSADLRFSVGGSLGESYHALSFRESTLLNYDERVRSSFHAGLEWRLVDGWGLSGGWEWLSLEGEGLQGETLSSDAHFFTLGFSYSDWDLY